MTNYKFGEIVLIDFSQSDGNKKKRPAFIVLDIGDNDIVVSPITTKKRDGSGDCKIKNWADGGLLMESWARLAKISCLAKSDIECSLGHLTDYDRRKISFLWNKLYSF